jgi:hypothetical protein
MGNTFFSIFYDNPFKYKKPLRPGDYKEVEFALMIIHGTSPLSASLDCV